MRRLAALALAALTASCSGRCGAVADRDAPRDDDEPVPLDPLEGGDAATLGPARCAPPSPVGAHAQLVGNAVPGPDALWVSVVAADPPALSVLMVPSGPATTLRMQPGDAPPAVLAADGAGFVAAYFGAPGKKDQSVDVVRVAAPGEAPTPLAHFTRPPDESLAIDLAMLGGVPHVVWNEDGGLTVRHADARLVLPASAYTLESPRIVAHGGHLAVIAIERRWDAADAGVRTGPQTTWEGAGEPRSTSWLVGYSLDGQPVGVLLTPVSGHVDAFDVASSEGKPDELVVFAHDAAQSEMHSGGSLLRIRWSGGTNAERSTFRSSDVGTGPIAIVGGALTYGNADGAAVLVPLTADLHDAGRASREPSMDDARMIATWAGRGILMATPDLAWMACAP